MQSDDSAKKLNRNITLFGVYKIFTKRVFIPLTTIYATQQAGLNIQQIGFTTAIASVTSLLLDTTTGYWADVHGRRKSAQVGSIAAALSTLMYVFSTNFIGILSASIVMAIGYSFMNGAIEALIHDTLVSLGQEGSYSKVASRAQSLSLVINAVFVSLVTLLYPIDRRLPFVVGFLAYCSLYIVSSMFTEPHIVHEVTQVKLNFIKAVRMLLTRNTGLFFFCVGLAYAVSTGTTDVFNLALIKLGMQPRFLGIIFGGTSLIGAILGIWVHNLKRLSFKQYATFDVTINLMPFLVYGLARNLPLAILIFVINFSFWRYESIIYQHYVLEIYGTSRYKATIVSLMTNFRSLHEIWIALAITSAAKHFGILNSIAYSSIFIVLFLPLFLFSISQFSAHARADVKSLAQ